MWVKKYLISANYKYRVISNALKQSTMQTISFCTSFQWTHHLSTLYTISNAESQEKSSMFHTYIIQICFFRVFRGIFEKNQSFDWLKVEFPNFWGCLSTFQLDRCKINLSKVLFHRMFMPGELSEDAWCLPLKASTTFCFEVLFSYHMIDFLLIRISIRSPRYDEKK